MTLARRLVGPFADVGLVALGVGVLALYSSWGRPIWVDEYLFYALGAMDVQEVLTVIHNTSSEINHGQTGAYMLADWGMLQLFGASSFALRLPSLLAGALLFFSAVLVIRSRGFARPWQYLVVGLLACQSFLMYFVGEARPYSVLAATSVAALAYYQLEPTRRRSFLGWFLIVLGIWLGAVNHPYFPLMLAVVIPVSLWTAHRSGWLGSSWREVLRFLDWPVLVVAAFLYVGVGALTWLRGTPDFGYDPFQILGSREATIDLFWRDHLGLLSGYRGWILPFLLLVVAVLALNRFRGVWNLVAPVALGVLAVGTSVAVSLASYLNDYWIIERQWVAGIALLAVAVVWFTAEIFTAAPGRLRWVSAVPGLALGLVVVQGLVGVWESQIGQLGSFAEQQEQIAADSRSLEQLISDGAEWPYIANVNISRGGEVWPVFTEWYGRQAGMREEE